MNERVISKDTIMVPARLAPVIDQLVIEYAAAHDETPENCRRAVEITILQRGVAALQSEANLKFGVRMGWATEEGENGEEK